LECEVGRGTPECAALQCELSSLASGVANEEELINASYLQELRFLVERLAGISTRRTLILISDGFQLVPGREAFGLMSVYFPNVPGWRLRKLSNGTQDQFQAILHMAAKRDVLIYTIDSRGLDGAISAAAAPVLQLETEAAALESGDPLQQLARATGGTYFHNSNDLLQGLKRVFADSREYYVLAYVPKNASSDGTFRAIRVQVKGNGLKVRSKPGYWATEK